MSDSRLPADPCGAVDLTPRRPENRAALAALTARISRHPDFLARMLARIARETVDDPVTGSRTRPLAGLSARTTDDPTISLMDAWAATLDVLTFYQERIVNEGYLRTAVERVSALELARTIGYELDAGVAASAHLAFTVESADDPFRVVEVPAGTRVMSVPKATGERPQVFETLEAIAARAEWNRIPARTERDQSLAVYLNPEDPEDEDNGTLYLLDLDASFDLSEADPDDLVSIDSATVGSYLPVTPGLDLEAVLAELEEDRLLNPEIEAVIQGVAVDHLHLRGVGLAIDPGDRLVLVAVRASEDGPGVIKAFPQRVVAVEEDAAYAMTRVDLAPLGGPPRPRRRLRLRFRPARLRPGVVPTTRVSFDESNVTRIVRRTTWSGAALSAFVRTQAWPRVKLMRLVRRPPDLDSPEIGEVSPGVVVLRQSVGFFGHAASRWESLAKSDESRGGTTDDPYKVSWEPSGSPRPVWVDSQGQPLTDADLFLEREVAEIVPGGWVVLETPQGEARSWLVGAAATQSRSDFALSGKATGLLLREPDDSDFSAFTAGGTVKGELAPFTFRTATAHVASQAVALAGLPIREDVAAGADELMLDSLYLDLEPGRAVSVAGERADAQGVEEAETLMLADVVHTGGHTRLRFADGPEYAYLRPTVRVNANVALASHGEGVDEALGSGDATRANQAFALAKPPLTFVSAATATGSASSLTVRVDGVAWREVPSLWEAGPEDEAYMVRVDDDGTTRVVFGDGEHGRRLPTGALNVTASYRTGMGTEGEVDQETLIQLKIRPLGVRSVSNPSPASGAAAAESLEQVRERAPRSVRTLGRIVSLTDYQDFALTFAGIGKARAEALWRGRERVVHLTVTPATDSVFDPAAPTLDNLRQAMEALRDPARRLIVAPHRPRLFQLAARVFHDPRFPAREVEAAVLGRLELRFSYAERALAQPVSAAEVIATVQEVEGVDHVDLDALEPYRDDVAGAAPSLATVLPASPARVSDEGDPPAITAAELLTIFGAAITLELEAAGA